MGRARSVPASSSSLLALERWFLGLIGCLPEERIYAFPANARKFRRGQMRPIGIGLDGRRREKDTRNRRRRRLPGGRPPGFCRPPRLFPRTSDPRARFFSRPVFPALSRDWRAPPGLVVA